MNKRKPKASPKKPNDLEPVFARLKQILESCKEGWVVKGDPQRYTYLESASAVCRGRPLWFGAVRIGKNYVSFHLMPLYMNPPLLRAVSPSLKKRMQGKTCFNFKAALEPELLQALRQLVEAAMTDWTAKKYV